MRKESHQKEKEVSNEVEVDMKEMGKRFLMTLTFMMQRAFLPMSVFGPARITFTSLCVCAIVCLFLR